MPDVLRFNGTSAACMSPMSRDLPPASPSDHEFFVLRVELLTTNTSTPYWQPECGVRFACGEQPASMPAPTRSSAPYEALRTRPELFAPPLWRVACRGVATRVFVDLYVDVAVLRDHVQSGTPIGGRRVLIDTVRRVRAIAGLDGLTTCDNFVLWYLWPSMRPSLVTGAAYSYDCATDLMAMAEATSSVPDERPLLDVAPVQLHTRPFDAQLRVVRRMRVAEVGVPCRTTPPDCVRIGQGRVDDEAIEVFVDKNERLDTRVGEHVTMRGGYLWGNMGTGKTFTMLLACEFDRRRADDCSVKRPRGTLVVCPAQVVKHWVDELRKHIARPLRIVVLSTRRHLQSTTFGDVADADYVVFSYNLFANPYFREFCDLYSPNCPFRTRCDTYAEELDRATPRLHRRVNPFILFFEWHRVVVDEFHEMSVCVCPNIALAITGIRAERRWMISGSPFVEPSMVPHEVQRFFWPDGWLDYGVMIHAARHNFVCARGMVQQLPRLTERVIYTRLASLERSVYESLSHCRSQQLRACSAACQLGAQSATRVTSMDEMHALVREHMQQQLQSVRDRVEGLTAGAAPTDAIGRLAQYYREFEAERQRLEQQQHTLERSIRFLDTREAPADAADCPICLSSLRDADRLAVIKACGHAFCEDCLSRAAASQGRCPVCRVGVRMSRDAVVVVSSEEGGESDRNRHGTRIAALLRVLAELAGQKVIVFSQWEDMLMRVGAALRETMPVLFCRGSVQQKQSSIDRFRTSDAHNVILLSSINSGSGCDLSVASTVVLLDMIDGTPAFVLGCERQAVSRCYRLGQSRDVQVIRFIAADTLEEELYLRTYAGVDYEDFYRAHLEHDARR